MPRLNNIFSQINAFLIFLHLGCSAAPNKSKQDQQNQGIAQSINFPSLLQLLPASSYSPFTFRPLYSIISNSPYSLLCPSVLASHHSASPPSFLKCPSDFCRHRHSFLLIVRFVFLLAFPGIQYLIRAFDSVARCEKIHCQISTKIPRFWHMFQSRLVGR